MSNIIQKDQVVNKKFEFSAEVVGERFEENDYIDPEWGLTKGIELKIMKKANTEIAEFNELKQELITALINGERLQSTLTDKYNITVSLYGSEVTDE